MADMTRTAIIGSGITGLGAAYILDSVRDVVVYEAAERLGGHTNTVIANDPQNGPISIDTGFIVHNDRNYPNLVRLFDELGIERQDSEMSFGVHDPEAGISYRATNPRTLLASPSNILRSGYWRMLRDIPRFWRDANRYLNHPDQKLSLGAFLRNNNYSREFIDWHLIPMGAAIWSSDPTTFDDFPLISLLTFLRNHGLLGLGDRPQWRTVTGGAKRYVEAIEDRLQAEFHRSSPVHRVQRMANGIEVSSPAGTEVFDEVIIACHTDQALDMLVDAQPNEKEALGAIRYQPNIAVLHTDTSVLPPARQAWSAWNYHMVPNAAAPTVTYDLTRLQRLPGSRRYLVSLNLDHLIDETTVLGRFHYSHPVFDQPALDAQVQLDHFNGQGGVYFGGAWAGYGFHEDGFCAAIRICDKMGVRW